MKSQAGSRRKGEVDVRRAEAHCHHFKPLVPECRFSFSPQSSFTKHQAATGSSLSIAENRDYLCRGHRWPRSLQRLLCGAGLARFRTSVPEERGLKGSVWPGAGSLSSFHPPNNNSNKRLWVLPAASPVGLRKEPRLAHLEQNNKNSESCGR